MIKIRIDKNRLGEPIFKIGVTDDEANNRILKRSLIEGKPIKGIYNYKIPMKYFLPIFKNIDSNKIILDTRSIDNYFEFSDELEEEFYYTLEITPKYMRKWREENCPNIFKIEIDKSNKTLNKRLAFKKIKHLG